MSTTSKTPRTDAVETELESMGCFYPCVDVDFARQLETELTAAQAENARLREALQQILYGIGNADNQMSEGNLQIIASIGNMAQQALNQTN